MAGGVRLKLKVIPNAPRNEVVGWRGGLLTVKVTARPVEGKANRALVEFIAEVMGVSPADVELVAGETSRQKSVAVMGLSADEARARLQQHSR